MLHFISDVSQWLPPVTKRADRIQVSMAMVRCADGLGATSAQSVYRFTPFCKWLQAARWLAISYSQSAHM
jgi:hypothetical protein